MKHSETLSKIAPQLVAALGKIEGAAKKAKNPHFKSAYANLETVIDASRDILTEHGLTLLQLPGACSGGVMSLETVIMHESGEWISGEMGIALGKTDPQGVGSALTYARRYAQMAVLNMPAVDDDGEAAMKGRKVNPMSANQAKQDGRGERFNKLKHDLTDCQDFTDLGLWAKANKDEIATFPPAWQEQLRADYDTQRQAIAKAADNFRDGGDDSMAGDNGDDPVAA